MPFPQNPVAGEYYKGYLWDVDQGLWVKNETAVKLLNQDETAVLPPRAAIGDSLDFHFPAETGYAYLEHGKSDGTILRGYDHTPTGGKGLFRVRPQQAVKLVYRGDSLEHKEQYEILENILDVLPTGEVTCMAVDSRGMYIAIGHKNAPFLSVYERTESTFSKLGDGNIGRELTAEITSVSIFQDSNNNVRIYTGITEGTLHLFYSINNNELIRHGYSSPNTGATYSVSISPDNAYIAEGHSAGSLTITKISDNTEVDHPSTTTSSTDVIHSLAFSPKPLEGHDQLLAVGHLGNPFLTFLSFKDGVVTKMSARNIRYRSGVINSMAWSHDGLLLAVELDGSEIHVYDMSSGEPVRVAENTFTKHPGTVYQTVSFSPSKVLAVSWGSEENDFASQVDFYDFSNGVPAGKLDSPQLTGLTGPIGGAMWTAGEGYFLVGSTTAPFLTVYLAIDFATAVWQVVHLDGAKPTSNDFKIVT